MTSDPLLLRILGTSFLVPAEHAIAFDDLRRLWAPFNSPESSGGPAVSRHPLVVGDQSGGDLLAEPERLRILTAELNRGALERYTGFAAHAGVVAFGSRVIAMPAVSGTGKTTMAAACIAAGATYVSDEALCVRYADGQVEPYPKPLALSRWSAAAVGFDAGTDTGAEVLATAGDLGGDAASSALALTDVIRLERAPSGAAPDLRPLHRAEAVPLLLSMSFNHYRRSAESFTLVTALAQTCRTWTLSYADPMAAAATLAARLR